MKLSRELWLEVGPLLSAALDLEPPARAAWLAGIDQSHPEMAPIVRQMLATHERAERSGELETLPRVASGSAWSSVHQSQARIGPFQLTRLLGHGGMGEVWLARQVDGRVERNLALKLPAVHLQGEWRERFRRERDILARLEHPNIARLYDAGVTDAGQPWLAMELVEGLSLAEHVAARSPSMAGRLALFRQVLAAVAHAHRHLVVHRDLKPANILIDAAGQVKLLDFGIAKLVDESEGAARALDLTRTGGRVMTLRYAAPEQVAAGTVTTVTDVYSLGVILHELVTGLSPYRAARDGRALTDLMLLQEEIAVPSALAVPGPIARALSGDLDAIVLKAMRRNPADRYASVELLDEDIHAHLERRPVKARAGTWRYLAGRFAARNKFPLAMAGAIVASLAVGLVMMDHQRRVAVAERERAQKHFASVRKLANTFIFDVHAEIENLSGSLKAREMLVATSLEYLDAMVDEAGGDPVLMYDLAAGYRRIGNILGEPGTASRNDVTKAIGHYEKAARLLDALVRARPGDLDASREYRALSYALHRSYFRNADVRWQQQAAVTVDLAQRLAALPGASLPDRAFAPLAMSDRAQLTGLIAGRSPALEREASDAIALLEALLVESPRQAVVRRNLARAHARAASILVGKGRTPESVRQAVEHRRTSLGILRELAAENRDDTSLREVELGGMIYLANALYFAGELREADRTIGEALALARSLRERDPDPNNTEPGIRMLTALAQAAEVAYGLGDLPRAIRRGREALALAASLPAGAQQSRDLRDDVTWTKATLGLALLAQAGAGSASARLALLGEARTFLAERIAFIAEAGETGTGAWDESEVAAVRDGLAISEAEIERLIGNQRP